MYNQLLHDGAQNGSQEQVEQAEYLPVIFCRALYDYKAEDLSSLSFSRGNVIEVLTQLETGWWDGLLNGQRGWFPSNYVVPISAEEAEQELRVNPDDSEWVQDSQEHVGPTNDFWMPQVTTDGRVSNSGFGFTYSKFDIPIRSSTSTLKLARVQTNCRMKWTQT